MKTLGLNGMKVLKILHIIFSIMWIGGVMALVSIILGSRPVGAEQIYMAARDHLVIDKVFLIPGGVGIVFSAIAYSVFTKWGFFKFMWVRVKWILTLLLVLIGKVYMGVILEKNMVLAESLLRGNGDSSQFFLNAGHVAVAGIIQLLGFAAVIVISVVKPWTASKAAISKKNFVLLLSGVSMHAAGKLLHLQGDEILFFPGAACFVVGHVCYLIALISGLGGLKKILLVPFLLFWIPPYAIGADFPMAVLIAVVMLCIFMYISVGTAGLLSGNKAYLPALAGGLLFFVSDAISGTACAEHLYAVSQTAFYLGEAAVMLSVIRTVQR